MKIKPRPCPICGAMHGEPHITRPPTPEEAEAICLRLERLRGKAMKLVADIEDVHIKAMVIRDKVKT